ncbi:Hypothetical protein A7982_11850 [Minicystis rosea]|nr:Hypothetical protein A7982_11850 [Minicystis rosea]
MRCNGATERGATVQKVTLLALDDVVNGKGYTPDHYSSTLGECDNLNIQLTVELPSATSGGTSVKLVIEHSGDGRTWMSKNTTPEINGVALGSLPVTTTLTVFDAGTKPSLGLVRFRLEFTNTVTGVAMAAKVKLYVMGRDLGAGKPINERVEIPSGVVTRMPSRRAESRSSGGVSALTSLLARGSVSVREGKVVLKPGAPHQPQTPPSPPQITKTTTLNSDGSTTVVIKSTKGSVVVTTDPFDKNPWVNSGAAIYGKDNAMNASTFVIDRDTGDMVFIGGGISSIGSSDVVVIGKSDGTPKEIWGHWTDELGTVTAIVVQTNSDGSASMTETVTTVEDDGSKVTVRTVSPDGKCTEEIFVTDEGGNRTDTISASKNCKRDTEVKKTLNDSTVEGDDDDDGDDDDEDVDEDDGDEDEDDLGEAEDDMIFTGGRSSDDDADEGPPDLNLRFLHGFDPNASASPSNNDGGLTDWTAPEEPIDLVALLRGKRGGGGGGHPGGTVGWGDSTSDESPNEIDPKAVRGGRVISSADDSGWGDLNHPNAFVSLLASILGTSPAGIARSVAQAALRSRN